MNQNQTSATFGLRKYLFRVEGNWQHHPRRTHIAFTVVDYNREEMKLIITSRGTVIDSFYYTATQMHCHLFLNCPRLGFRVRMEEGDVLNRFQVCFESESSFNNCVEMLLQILGVELIDEIRGSDTNAQQSQTWGTQDTNFASVWAHGGLDQVYPCWPPCSTQSSTWEPSQIMSAPLSQPSTATSWLYQPPSWSKRQPVLAVHQGNCQAPWSTATTGAHYQYGGFAGLTPLPPSGHQEWMQLAQNLLNQLQSAVSTISREFTAPMPVSGATVGQNMSNEFQRDFTSSRVTSMIELLETGYGVEEIIKILENPRFPKLVEAIEKLYNLK